jgi:hypothetical protein
VAGLEWIKVDVDVGGHPKIEELERSLGPAALGVLVRAWCWTAKYCPDGFIPDDRVESLERAVGMACVEAFVAAGVTDRNGARNGYEMHGWDEIQTAHVDKVTRAREANRERQRRFRERNALRNAGHNAEVTPERRGEERRGEETEASAPASPPLLEAARVEKPKPSPKQADPRVTPLTESLCAAFADVRGDKYLHGGAPDAAALKRLLALADAPEIVRRWRLALADEGYHRCNSFAELSTARNWNHFARGALQPVSRMRDLKTIGDRS